MRFDIIKSKNVSYEYFIVKDKVENYTFKRHIWYYYRCLMLLKKYDSMSLRIGGLRGIKFEV